MLGSLRRAALGAGGQLSGARSLSKLTSLIGDKERAAFERDGAICVRGAFGPEWVETLRAVAERNLRAPGPLVDEHTPVGEPGAQHGYEATPPCESRAASPCPVELPPTRSACRGAHVARSLCALIYV